MMHFIGIWRPPSLSELTPMIFNIGLIHLGLEASIKYILFQLKKLSKTNIFFCFFTLKMDELILKESVMSIRTELVYAHKVNIKFIYFNTPTGL